MLIDRVYELEGLLLLLQQRKDLTQSFKDIIVNKSRAILEEAELLQTSEAAPLAAETEFEEAAEAFPDSPETEAAEQAIPISENIPAVAQQKPGGSAAGKIRFPINERIRFSHELFAADTARFNSTVAYVESLPDWTDVEDYFYSELQWDPSEKNVADFIEMLRHLYNRSHK